MARRRNTIYSGRVGDYFIVASDNLLPNPKSSFLKPGTWTKGRIVDQDRFTAVLVIFITPDSTFK
jgi:hypothetical protein